MVPGRFAAAGVLALAVPLAACDGAGDPALGALRLERLAATAVPAGIAARAADELFEHFPQGDAGRTQIHRAELPDGLELYVLWIDGRPPSPPSAHLIVRRRADGALSPAASCWHAHWESGVDEVLAGLRLADLEGDGRWQLVYRQREHNGTMHNELTDHYLCVGSDLAFREELAMAPWTLDVWSLADAGAITRTVKPLRPGELLLEVRTENPEYGDSGTVLGRARLFRSSATDDYEIEETQVLVARYADFISLRTGGDDR